MGLQNYLMSKLIENSAIGKKIQSSNSVSKKGQMALDATEKNPNIEGSLAEEIANLQNTADKLQASIKNLISLPNGATTGDGQIEDAKVGIEGEAYDTLGDAIRDQIKTYRDVELSNKTPTSKAKVWVNTSANDDDEQDIVIPQIDDENANTENTWSSKKIKSKIDEINTALAILSTMKCVDGITWELGMLDTTSGALNTSNNRITTKEYIDVHEGDVISLTDYDNYSYSLVFYKNDTKDYLKSLEGWQTGDHVVTPDEDGCSIKSSVRRNDDSEIVTVATSSNSGISGVSHTYRIFTPQIITSAAQLSKWRDKNIIVYGDDFSDEAKFGIQKYCTLLGNWLHANVKNVSTTGAGYVNWSYRNTDSLVEQVKIDYGNKYDLVILFAGSNDFSGGDGVEIKDFKEGVDSVINTLMEKYPSATFLIATPLPRKNGTTANSKGAVLEDYCEVLRDAHKKYCIPMIDLYYDANFRAFNSDFASKNTYNSDGIHPTGKFHERLAHMFMNKIDSI